MSVGAKIERFGPLTIGAAVAAVSYFYAGKVGANLASGSWNLPSLYAAMFDWSAVQSAFLFGVFGFVVSSGNDFLVRLRRTPQMSQFLRFTRRAVIAGFLLTIISMPLLVAGPQQWPSETLPNIGLSLWIGLSTWTVALFVRSALIFMVLWKRDDGREREVLA